MKKFVVKEIGTAFVSMDIDMEVVVIINSNGSHKISLSQYENTLGSFQEGKFIPNVTAIETL